MNDKLYQVIDMDNGNCWMDRLTLEEAIKEMQSEPNLAVMQMMDEDDNFSVCCSFCGRKGFAPVEQHEANKFYV